MKIDIVVVYIQRYERGHEVDFVPPITGIHLAAITPPGHSVRVVHQQVEPVRFDTDADLIALSFFSGFAPEAYRLAAEFRRRGKIVVAGGPHATFSPEEVLRHCDSVVLGEAESAWPRLLDDAEAGRLRPRYEGEPSPMCGLPTPRYDLLPRRFFVTRVVQATRGCPFTCSFCTVPTLNPGFRMRPVEDVLRDVRYDDFAFWWQRKVVWFWDDNLTIRREVRARVARTDGAAQAVVADAGEHGHRQGRPAPRPHAHPAVSGFLRHRVVWRGFTPKTPASGRTASPSTASGSRRCTGAASA